MRVKILIKSGIVVNPQNNHVGQCDIRIEDERITEIGENLSEKEEDQVIDATNLFIRSEERRVWKDC